MNDLNSICILIFGIIMLLSAGQALMSVILLLINLKNQSSNLMLALWFLIWGLSCYFFYCYIHGAPLLYPPFIAFAGPMVPIMLYPPLYLYVKHLFFEQKYLVKGDIIHFLPLLAYFVFSLYMYYDMGGTTELMRKHELYHFRSIAISYIAVFQGTLYFFLIRKILKQQENKLKQQYSDIEEIKLDWVYVINILSLPVMIFGTASAIVKSTSIDPFLLFILYHIFISVCLYYISFKLILRPVYLTGKKVEYCSKNVFQIENSSSKHEREELVNPKYEQVAKDLLTIMQEKCLFRNFDITLPQLANELNVSRNELSYALNHILNCSFYDYINHLRIEDCKQRMKNPKFKNYSIIAIAYDAGFKSKAVFNRNFKQKEGLTPSEYRLHIENLT